MDQDTPIPKPESYIPEVIAEVNTKVYCHFSGGK
jgi:hypothetical protein